MHLADAFIQSDLQCIQAIHFFSMCVPWELNLQPLHCYCNALPLSHRNTKFRWALFVTYTIIQSITSSEMCSLHLTHPSAHTPGAVLRRPGNSWGFGALLKGLTSVVDNSCRSRDSNPQPRVTSQTLYPLEPRLPISFYLLFSVFILNLVKVLAHI